MAFVGDQFPVRHFVVLLQKLLAYSLYFFLDRVFEEVYLTRSNSFWKHNEIRPQLESKVAELR